MKLFLIVGPSGSGKDTLINYAVGRVPGLKKIRRVITRPPNNFEDFESVDYCEFDKRDFLITWEVFGVKYGIPKLEEGNYIVNVSRSVVPKIKEIFPNTKVIKLTAPKEILIQRQIKRGRDPLNVILKRVERDFDIDCDIEIDTSFSDIRIAGEKLVNFINKELLKK